MKRRELSAAPSAVCPAAGGRTSTWLQETPPAAAAAPSLLPQALSNPLLGLSMATPTQSPTNVPEETDPFFYDYATVQTVGMTLATIMFVLGILIILSKKVKCRKADSRSESPTCKSCKSELPSSAPGGGGV